MEPGALVWLQPGTVREVSFDSTVGRMTQMYLRFSLSDGTSAADSPGPLVLRHEPTVEKPFRAVIEALEAHNSRLDYPGWVRLRARLQLLLCEIVERGESHDPSGGRRLSERQQQQVRRIVQADPAGRHTPRELARAAGLSAEYFSELFRATHGVSVRRWLVEQRIRAAARCLIETTLSISEVAERFGYGDIYLFSRQFKLITGENPSAYRRNMG